MDTKRTLALAAGIGLLASAASLGALSSAGGATMALWHDADGSGTSIGIASAKVSYGFVGKYGSDDPLTSFTGEWGNSVQVKLPAQVQTDLDATGSVAVPIQVDLAANGGHIELWNDINVSGIPDDVDWAFGEVYSAEACTTDLETNIGQDRDAEFYVSNSDPASRETSTRYACLLLSTGRGGTYSNTATVTGTATDSGGNPIPVPTATSNTWTAPVKPGHVDISDIQISHTPDTRHLWDLCGGGAE